MYFYVKNLHSLMKIAGACTRFHVTGGCAFCSPGVKAPNRIHPGQCPMGRSPL